MKRHEADVCIVGAGPAGMVLGLLLAHENLNVLVLERQKDFQREYRGEVLMPRFTQMFRQIGLFDWIEQYPHLKLKHLEVFYRNTEIASLYFANITPDVPFAIWMPQPVLLGALHDKAKTYPNFQIWFEASAESLISEGDKVVGVNVKHQGEMVEVRSSVTVGCDGRTSMILNRGGFELDKDEHDFDIIWFTIDKPADYDNTVRAFFSPRKSFLILPKYPDEIQCGIVVSPNEFLNYKKKGIESLRRDLLSAHSILHPFAKSLQDFKPFNVLQARVHHVKDWEKNGCLLVGDSAHTCSPAGAIGVSVAVGTAIVAAEVISEAFKSKDFSKEKLNQVQNIRDGEVKRIQRAQAVFSRLFFNKISFIRRLAPAILFVLGKTGLFKMIQKRIAAQPAPLPVHISFKKEPMEKTK